MTRLMRLRIFCVLMSFLSTSAFASYADLPSYYPTELVSKLSSRSIRDAELRKALGQIISMAHIKTESRDIIGRFCPSNDECEMHITTRSYREARELMFGKVDLKFDGSGYYVEDVYCEQYVDESQGAGPGKIPNHTYMNCEHTWPQSRFNPNEDKNAQLTDLHHLYPANSRANSSRGNHIFAEVDGNPVNEECTASYRGRALGSSEIAFEPPAQHKGDVARALFYFSTRYNHPIGPLEESFLKRWHSEDPVDQAERERHERIYEVQKNRNPYVDAPELVELVKDF